VGLLQVPGDCGCERETWGLNWFEGRGVKNAEDKFTAKFICKSGERGDLISEGSLGLARAVKKFSRGQAIRLKSWLRENLCWKGWFQDLGGGKDFQGRSRGKGKKR